MKTILSSRLVVKSTLVFLLLFVSQTVFAQLIDNFSDGNFTQNPTWVGATEKFTVNSSLQLQLNDTQAGTAWLSTPYSAATGTMEWRFWIRLNFSPSATNFAEVYLSGNNPNLSEPLNGYFLRFGENLANDPVELFKKQGTVTTSLCRGTPGLVANAFAISVKVTRSASGVWKIYADQTNMGLYQLEATAIDNAFSPGGHFGFLCQYTVSNIKNYFFDNVYVGSEIVDNTPPVIEKVLALSPNNLVVTFNEVVDQIIAVNSNNYSVNNNVGVAASAAIGTTPVQVVLQFVNSFQSGAENTLTVRNIRDLSGNLMPETQVKFLYYKPKLHDVVINEIMADPTPTIGLPAYEFFELHNTTAFPVDLSGWVFQHSGSKRTLPSVELAPKGYLILCNSLALDELKRFGPIAVIEGLSSTALTNSGATLSIYDKDGLLIHSVIYSDEWYESSAKKEGGWTLEMIDPANPCGESTNWKASVDLSGGTPGKQNSVYARNPDTQSPDIDRILIIDSRTVTVYFTEKMNPGLLGNLQAYRVDYNIGAPASAIINDPLHDAVTLSFSSTFQDNIIYSLSVTGQISDCAGNLISANSSKRFAVPKTAGTNDLVINELLFNPPAGCEDYVELYNRSNKVIDLRSLRLSSYDSALQILSSVKEITSTGYLMFPGEYLVLTTRPDQVKANYRTSNPRGFLKMTSFPSYNNASGVVVLSDLNETVIDRLVYTEKMHFALLTTYKGVALERIHPDRPSSDPTNWHSASSQVGYGTPAYRNSQFVAAEAKEGDFSVSPDIFSPDNDGYNDVLNIVYSLPAPGYMANIVIYDAQGRLIRRLVLNQLLGASGTFSWDGISDRNEKASVGYYVILIETYDLAGKLRQYKKTAVLGGRL